MSYWNPIERYGVDRFATDLAAAGGAGAITPDLIPDEAGGWIAASDSAGLDRVFLVAPSSTDARLRSTAAGARASRKRCSTASSAACAPPSACPTAPPRSTPRTSGTPRAAAAAAPPSPSVGCGWPGRTPDAGTQPGNGAPGRA